jgi:hypothetical protein
MQRHHKELVGATSLQLITIDNHANLLCSSFKTDATSAAPSCVIPLPSLPVDERGEICEG